MCSSAGPLLAAGTGDLVPLGLGRLLAEGFQRCGCGASGDLGQGHEFGDGGQRSVAGGVAGRGGLCADPSGCGVAGCGGPYNRDRC